MSERPSVPTRNAEEEKNDRQRSALWKLQLQCREDDECMRTPSSSNVSTPCEEDIHTRSKG